MEVTLTEVQNAMSEEWERYFNLVDLYMELHCPDDALFGKEEADAVLKEATEYAYSARENAISEEPDENLKKIKLASLEMLHAEALREYEENLEEFFKQNEA